MAGGVLSSLRWSPKSLPSYVQFSVKLGGDRDLLRALLPCFLVVGGIVAAKSFFLLEEAIGQPGQLRYPSL